MTTEITPHMQQIYEWRRQRMTFEQIGKALGITRQAAHDSYTRALTHIHKRNQQQDLPDGMTIDDLYRLEELDYIDGVLQRYMRLADNNEGKSPRTAVEALNGAHRYLDSLIKLKGINAPLKVQHTITNSDLEAELLKVKSELAHMVIDSQVVKEIDA